MTLAAVPATTVDGKEPGMASTNGRLCIHSASRGVRVGVLRIGPRAKAAMVCAAAATALLLLAAAQGGDTKPSSTTASAPASQPEATKVTVNMPSAESMVDYLMDCGLPRERTTGIALCKAIQKRIASLDLRGNTVSWTLCLGKVSKAANGDLTVSAISPTEARRFTLHQVALSIPKDHADEKLAVEGSIVTVSGTVEDYRLLVLPSNDHAAFTVKLGDCRLAAAPKRAEEQALAALEKHQLSRWEAAGIAEISPDTAGVCIFVLDASGSTAEAGGFDRTRTEVTRLVLALRESQSFAIILSRETPTVFPAARPVKATPENIDKALKLLTPVIPEGQTGIRPALQKAYGLALGEQNASRVIHFYSDGSTEPADAKGVLTLLKANGKRVPINTHWTEHNGDDDEAMELMQGIAEQTGGQVHPHRDALRFRLRQSQAPRPALHSRKAKQGWPCGPDAKPQASGPTAIRYSPIATRFRFSRR